uniref:GlxA family transcriptional regulator n=1 Tax=Ningiella ruwaisensis TaxID=2364274 RepID=UPI00109F6D1A|nr:helix-turn-helix domain-containing protein [Ningiella ruwaisensis]
MPYFKPYIVTIVGFNGALASAITGALDIFSFAGVSWQRLNQQRVQQRFKVQIASMHGLPFECTNKLTLQAHCDIASLNETDILLIPTVGASIEKVLNENEQLCTHLKRLANYDCDVASNCSGAFLLAKAGLLENKTATTHWGYETQLREMFPKVKLAIDKLVTQDERIYCAGGGLAFHHLCLMLIERYCGRDIANQVAKAHVIDTHRHNQSAYTNLRPLKQHNQAHIIKVQEYIEDNFAKRLTINDLAALANITPRTLNRHFQKYVNMRPIEYIQSVRVEQAKRLLESGFTNTQSIASEIGYEDITSFAKLFKNLTGLTPSQYRAKFHREFDI